MSETPGGPEYYTPPPQAAPTPPPPPSISEAAAQYGSGSATPPYNPYTAAPGQRTTPPPPGGYPGAPSPAQGLAIASLVLGIIAIVSGWIPGWGTVIGILAVIFGIVALGKGQSKGMAVTGLVTGALGAMVSVFSLVVIIDGLTSAADPDNWFTYAPSDQDYVTEGGTTLGAVPVDGGIHVVEQAFGPTSWDDSVWWYVAVLENPSDTAFQAAEFTIEALDESGAVIDDEWTYVNLPSGETAVTGFLYEVGDADVASLAVVGPAAADLVATSYTGSVTAGDIVADTDDFMTTVTGQVTSTYDGEVYGGTVVIIARDADGNAVAAAPGYFEPIEPGQTVEFDAYFDSPVPEGAVFEAYVNTF